MDALWITRVGIFRARALRMMSVCVVALGVQITQAIRRPRTSDGVSYEPERISNNKKRHVLLVCIPQNLIAARLHHIAIGKNKWLAIELFLVPFSRSSDEDHGATH